MGKVDIFKIKVFKSNPKIFIGHSERSEEFTYEETLRFCLRVTDLSDEELHLLVINSEIPRDMESLGMTIDNRTNNA